MIIVTYRYAWRSSCSENNGQHAACVALLPSGQVTSGAPWVTATTETRARRNLNAIGIFCSWVAGGKTGSN